MKQKIHKKRHFPQGVARFFNSPLPVGMGTNQLKKASEHSEIIAYQGCGRPAIKTTNKYGQPIYVPQR